MNLRQRLALCARVLRAKPGNLLAHTRRELLPANGDEMQEAMNNGLEELVLVFSTQGHSGFSASYAVNALEKLLRYEPLRPLTGAPDEWNEVGNGVWQNKRCSRIFCDESRYGGAAYDINGKVFREPSGSCFTNKESHTLIYFPYTPTTEYVDAQAQQAVGEPTILGWSVHSLSDAGTGALYNREQHAEALDAAHRWGASITPLIAAQAQAGAGDEGEAG